MILDLHSAGQSQSMTSWSKSNQICIKRFHRSSMPWIFAYMHCCTTPKISKFKAHDDPSPLWWSCNHLMQFSLVISRCNITFSVFWLSQGSVATLIRWGGWNRYCHMCRSFVNLTVKTALKSVNFWLSYRQKLECGPMPNVMVALPNIGGALCSTPQSLADAHYLTAVQ